MEKKINNMNEINTIMSAVGILLVSFATLNYIFYDFDNAMSNADKDIPQS